ncbi:MAG: ADP-ribosylation factor-like protein [Geobacteraceae bacterium]
MALVNHVKKEINAKLVFFGPGKAGKATNLNYIYRKLKQEYKGSFKSMNIEKARMLFFDFVPAGQASLDEYTVRFHIYTIMGEVAKSSAWKMALKGVDGVVFVADSAPDRMTANQSSMKELTEFLGCYGKSLQDVAVVIQANKRDMADAVSLEALKDALNIQDIKLFPTAAVKGEGVLECAFTLVKMTLKKLRASGLELAGEVEQAPGMALESSGLVDGSSPPLPAEAAAVMEVTAPNLEIACEPATVAGCRLRLPLIVKVGGQEQKVFLSVSLENE